jgi:nucleoside-diphosphate-sugar epimerase
LLTGGNGFIGSSLVSRLVTTGHVVHALVNRKQELLDRLLPSECIHLIQQNDPEFVGDLVARIRPETVFHLAAFSREPSGPEELLQLIQANVSLGACLLFATTRCERPPVFVNAGTFWQFGEGPASPAKTLYAASKRAFHDILLYYRSLRGIRALTLIVYDTLGAGDRRPKLWNRLIDASAGAQIPLSPGEQLIHLLHIDDVVNAFTTAAELLHRDGPVDAVYSAASPAPRTLRDLVTAVNDRAALGLELEWGGIPYPDGQIFNPWVGKTLPGWSPRIDAFEALVNLALSKKAAGGEESGVERRKTGD